MVKVIDHLDEYTKRKINRYRHAKRKRKKKKKENMSFNEICSLMGMNKDTYKRGKGGAIRRRGR